MSREKIRVLVVDDSAFMRKAIKGMLDKDPDITVIDVARDGKEAVRKVAELKPDVVTMDVEMPVMDGITALKQIMAETPTPVIMLSSLTVEGAKATLDAFELGALDFIPKNLDDLSFNIFKVQVMITDKIKAVAKTKVTAAVHKKTATKIVDRRIGIKSDSQTVGNHIAHRIALVAIGASTGGPRAVQEVVEALPEGLPVAFIVVQHMPRNFTEPYAERLNHFSHLSVKHAEDGDIIKAGVVYVAPGGYQMRVVKKNALETRLVVEAGPADAIYRPSVDISFKSVAESLPGRAIGVILTGMGNDGMQGMKAIKATGGKTLAQDEESCVVYGMPKAVIDEKIQDKIVSLDNMAGEIVNMV